MTQLEKKKKLNIHSTKSRDNNQQRNFEFQSSFSYMSSSVQWIDPTCCECKFGKGPANENGVCLELVRNQQAVWWISNFFF